MRGVRSTCCRARIGSVKSTKPTSLDIAELAQVSQATVSRALRDSPLVRAGDPRTHPGIRARTSLSHRPQRRGLAHEAQPDARACCCSRNHRTRRKSTRSSSPCSATSRGAAARRSFDLLVAFQQLSDDWHTDYEVCNRADGLILLGYGDYLNYAGRLRQLAETDTHFVIWGPVVENQPGHYLCCDNALGARLRNSAPAGPLGDEALRYAAAALRSNYPEFQLRYSGYAEALREAGAEPDPRLQADAQSVEADGYRAGTQLLDSGRSSTRCFRRAT